MGAVQPGQPVAHEHRLRRRGGPLVWTGTMPGLYCTMLGCALAAEVLRRPPGVPDYTRAGVGRWT